MSSRLAHVQYIGVAVRQNARAKTERGVACVKK